MPANPDAFPRPHSESDNGTFPATDGMTLLDYFAGQALSGMLANTSTRQDEPGKNAKRAYEAAMSMLKEREKH